ncbi:hypothetical protein [Mesorhizobium sp. WSM2239]|uniref:Uncharacterized protein n=2 Tax=unclassified Mesorhizobium TaxID=325217 RepID=A0AAU8DJ23_9HYPH
MGRTLLVLSALMLFFAQARAQEWQRFGIERFGFVFDVPPEFELTQRSESGDGAAFHSPDGALLAVWGINLEQGDFLSRIKDQISQDEKEGWEFTYRRLTREWASYSGIKDDQIRYVRAITVCGDRAALFLMDYSRDKKVAYDPVVTRMVRSLKPEGC